MGLLTCSLQWMRSLCHFYSVVMINSPHHYFHIFFVNAVDDVAHPKVLPIAIFVVSVIVSHPIIHSTPYCHCSYWVIETPQTIPTRYYHYCYLPLSLQSMCDCDCWQVVGSQSAAWLVSGLLSLLYCVMSFQRCLLHLL